MAKSHRNTALRLATTLYYVEGAIRPVAASWLTNESILVLYSSGVMELLSDFRSGKSYVLREGLGSGRLVPDAQAGSVLAFCEAGVQRVRDDCGHATIEHVDFTEHIGTDAVCAVGGHGRHALASKDGRIWSSSDGERWEREGRLRIRGVTAGCAVGPDRFVFTSSRGDAEVVRPHPLSSSEPQRVHADAVQDVIRIDDSSVVSVGRDRALRMWTVDKTLAPTWALLDVHDHFINCACLVGEEVWTGGSDGTIAMTSLKQHRCIHRARLHADAVRLLRLSPDGHHVLTLADDATYSVVDVLSRTKVSTYGSRRKYIRSADFTIARNVSVIVGSTEGALGYGRADSGKLTSVAVSEVPLRAVRVLAPDLVLVGDETGALKTILSDRYIAEFRTEDPSVTGITSLRLDSARDRVLCGYRNGYVRSFSLSGIVAVCRRDKSDIRQASPGASVHGLSPLEARRIHESIVGDLLVRPDGTLLSCSDDHTVKRLLADSLATLSSTIVDGTAVNNLCASDTALVATTDGGNVYVLDYPTFRVRRRYVEHAGPVRALALVSARIVGTGDRLGGVKIWNIDSGKTLAESRFRERVIELAWDNADRRLWVATEAEIGSLDYRASVESGATETQSKKRPMIASYPRRKVLPVKSPHLAPELSRTPRDLRLTPSQDSILRWFVHWAGGERADIATLGGGLSDARVLRVNVFDDSGAARMHAVAKLAPMVAIQREIYNYDTEVARLRHDATPRRIVPDVVGNGTTAAVFYSLPQDFDRTEFQIAAENVELLPTFISRLESLMLPWVQSIPERRMTIREIRRSRVGDDVMRNLAREYRLDWIEEFERRSAQVRWCTVHGDLHGANILGNRSGDPLLIDYGEVGDGPAALDPVNLELSHFFHPAGTLRGGDWPDHAEAAAWRSDGYLRGRATDVLVRSCWRWATAVGAGEREISAAAYTYLLTQLSYRDTDKELIQALLRGAVTLYDGT